MNFYSFWGHKTNKANYYEALNNLISSMPNASAKVLGTLYATTTHAWSFLVVIIGYFIVSRMYLDMFFSMENFLEDFSHFMNDTR